MKDKQIKNTKKVSQIITFVVAVFIFPLTLFAETSTTELFSFSIPEGYSFRGYIYEGDAGSADEQDSYTVLSQNRQKAAFILKNEFEDVRHEEYVITVDKSGIIQEGRKYRHIFNLQLNHDGSIVTYVGEELNPEKSGSLYHVVVNGEHVATNARFVPNIVFSPDGMKYAYKKFIPNSDHYSLEYFVLSTGEKTSSYRSIDSFIFSSDSEHYAFSASVEGETILDFKTHVFIDNKSFVQLPDQSRTSNLIFSSDAKRLMFLVYKENNHNVLQIYKVSNGKRLKQYSFTETKRIRESVADYMILGRKIRSVPAFFVGDGKKVSFIVEKFKRQKSSTGSISNEVDIYSAVDGKKQPIADTIGGISEKTIYLTRGKEDFPLAAVDFTDEHRYYYLNKDEQYVSELRPPEYKIFLVYDDKNITHPDSGYQYMYDIEFSKSEDKITADVLDASAAPIVKVLHLELKM